MNWNNPVSNIYMKKNLREQLRSQSLPDDDLSEKEQQLLQHLLDKELEQKWAATLADKGVHRASPGFSLRRLRPWLMAAAILFAGAFGWWLWTSQQPKAQRMASVYLEQPFAINETLRDGQIGSDPQRSKSLQAYRDGNYRESLALITPLLPEKQAGDYFLAGLSSLYLTDYNNAAGYFQQARSIEPGAYTDEINWYLGIAYIMLEDDDLAEAELDKVIKSGSSRNKAQAKALLDALR